jgi:CRP-like cAMP-binding protein
MIQPTSAIFTHLRWVLQQAYFMQNLSLKHLDLLVVSLKAMRVFKGFEIIRQGESGDAFYLIAAGNVSVWLKKESRRVKVAELRADDFFGEMALISNEPRSATVVADGLTELFVLEKSVFEKILLKNPTIATKLRAACETRAAKNRRS